MRVAYLTIVYGDHVTDKAAHHLTDAFAGDVIAHGAVDAVKCDVAELDGTGEAEFWREADEA